MTIRDDLRSAIVNSGKSANQLAKETGVAQSVITRFLQGTDIRLSVVERLAAHFGLELRPVEPTPAPKRRR